MQAAITSMRNPKIQYVRSLERRQTRYQERRFVIEGLRLLEEAMRAGSMPALVLYTPSVMDQPDAAALLRDLKARRVAAESVAPQIMERISDTVTPQGVLAVVPIPDVPLPARPTLVLVVDRVANPGNLGTLLRAAEGAGVELVLLSRGTTDPFAPKVVRGGMGVHFRLPLRVDRDWGEMRADLRGLAVYLADIVGDVDYDQVDWARPSALIVSNEAHGPSPEARALAGSRVAIPMLGDTESLNVGVAGSIILFEAARQRRRTKPNC